MFFYHSKCGKLGASLTKLIESLKAASPSLNVEECLLLCFQGLLKGKIVSYPDIKKFVSQLERSVSGVCVCLLLLLCQPTQGLEFDSSKLYLALVPALNVKDQEIFRKVSSSYCGRNSKFSIKCCSDE